MFTFEIPLQGLSFFLIPCHFARDEIHCVALCVRATMKESESASQSPIFQPAPAVAAAAAGVTSSHNRSGKHTKNVVLLFGLYYCHDSPEHQVSSKSTFCELRLVAAHFMSQRGFIVFSNVLYVLLFCHGWDRSWIKKLNIYIYANQMPKLLVNRSVTFCHSAAPNRLWVSHCFQCQDACGKNTSNGNVVEVRIRRKLQVVIFQQLAGEVGNRAQRSSSRLQMCMRGHANQMPKLLVNRSVTFCHIVQRPIGFESATASNVRMHVAKTLPMATSSKFESGGNFKLSSSTYSRATRCSGTKAGSLTRHQNALLQPWHYE